MSKPVLKEGFQFWSGYLRKDHVQEIKRRAQEEKRTITVIVNEVIEKGLKKQEEA